MQKIRSFERIFCVYSLKLRTKITLGVSAYAVGQGLQSGLRRHNPVFIRSKSFFDTPYLFCMPKFLQSPFFTAAQ